MDCNALSKVILALLASLLALILVMVYRIWELRKACDVLAKGIAKILGINT